MNSIVATSKRKILLLQSLSETQNNFVPLGLAYIAAIFEKEGCEVRVIDASAPYGNYTVQSLLEEIKKYEPDLIGFSLTITFVNYSYQLIKEISKISSALIVAGGPHVTILPKEVLEHGAKIAIRGEGEETASDLIKYLNRQIGLPEILGISYIDDKNNIVDNPPRPQIANLDLIPFPAKHLIRKEDFFRSSADNIRYSNMITSRGCPGLCTYCANQYMWGRLVRYRSAENILSEMKLLQENYGVKIFNFFDDAFTANRKKTYELCEGMIKKLQGMRWHCITRVDLVDQNLLRKMKEAGCQHINYGVESGDPETLKRIRKMISLDQVKKALTWTKENGITAGVNFMHGFPWDTKESIQKTRNFIREIQPLVRDIMAGGILTPYPGTEIYEEYKDKYGFRDWWLKGRTLNSEDLKLAPPFFQKIFFYYDTLSYDYFKYSKEILSEIKKTIRLIGRQNLLFFSKKISRWPFYYIVREMLFILVLISKLLHKINPALERLLMRPFLMMAASEEADVRSKKEDEN